MTAVRVSRQRGDERTEPSDSEAAETFTIAELAREFGVTPRSIRFYEDKDLLRPARDGLNRIYNRRDRARLVLILRGKRLGFSLAEIKEMLDLYKLDDDRVEQLKYTLTRCRERLATLAQQRQDIENATTELNDICRQIEGTLTAKGVTVDET